jgi:outer membrane autotransporter protein
MKFLNKLALYAWLATLAFTSLAKANSVVASDTVYGSFSGSVAAGSAATLSWQSAGYHIANTNIYFVNSLGRIIADVYTNSDSYTLYSANSGRAGLGGTCTAGAGVVCVSATGLTQSLLPTINALNSNLGICCGVSTLSVIIDDGFTPASSASAYHSTSIASRRFAASNAALVLDNIALNPGAMSGVITALDGLSGAAQANAIAQTLPVITGAASQATTGSMQALNQVIQGRSNSLRGMSSGDEYIGNRDVWMKGFGSWANQNDVNGVSGYKINTGGLAIGIDQGITPKMNIGAVLAFANSGVSSNSSSAPSGVTVNSYQAGVYGDYAIDPKLIANAQVDIGLNNNQEYRNISFMGTNANGTYNSYSAHLGTGVKYLMPINPENTFIPSVRVDYTTVQSQAYTESGAGALNLSVGQQTYNTLIPSADLRIDHSLASKMTVSANAGAGYNTLNNQVSATSAYAGGGPAFATNGLQVSPWLYNAGVGITGQLEKNLQLNVRYDNVFSPTGYMNQMVSAKLKIPL